MLSFTRRLVVPVFAAVSAMMLVSSPVQAGPIAGDLNHDGDVDAGDVTSFVACMSGSGLPHDGSDMCDEADLDHDGDVDVADFGLIQACLSGPNIPADPMCGGCVRPRSNRTVSLVSSEVYVNDYAFVTVANSQEGVNYQLRNDADNSSIGSPVAGDGSTITLSSDPVAATTTFNVLAINVVWGCSVQLLTTVTVTTKTYVPHNKIGVHSIIGSRDNYGPFVTQCANANKHVAVVKCVDDFGPAGEAKGKLNGERTVTIGRLDWNELRGLDELVRAGMTGAEGAAWYYEKVKTQWSLNSSIDYWETTNEWSNWGSQGNLNHWQGDFYMAFMQIAEDHGYRLALWTCSYGNPPEWFYSEMIRTCQRAKSGGHILALHEYAPDGLMKDWYRDHGDDIVLRYRRLYAVLKQHNADCPLAITESGQNGGAGSFVGVGPFVADFAWYDSELRKDPYVLGCAAYSLGSSGCNFQDALMPLADYITSQP